MVVVLLIGPQCSGKKTVAGILRKTHGFRSIDVDALLDPSPHTNNDSENVIATESTGDDPSGISNKASRNGAKHCTEAIKNSLVGALFTRIRRVLRDFAVFTSVSRRNSVRFQRLSRSLTL